MYSSLYPPCKNSLGESKSNWQLKELIFGVAKNECANTTNGIKQSFNDVP